LNWGGKHTTINFLFPNLFSTFFSCDQNRRKPLPVLLLMFAKERICLSKAGANVLLFFLCASPLAKKLSDYYLIG